MKLNANSISRKFYFKPTIVLLLPFLPALATHKKKYIEQNNKIEALSSIIIHAVASAFHSPVHLVETRSPGYDLPKNRSHSSRSAIFKKLRCFALCIQDWLQNLYRYCDRGTGYYITLMCAHYYFAFTRRIVVSCNSRYLLVVHTIIAISTEAGSA